MMITYIYIYIFERSYFGNVLFGDVCGASISPAISTDIGSAMFGILQKSKDNFT